MKGRVVVCKEYGKPFVIEEYEVPEPAPGAAPNVQTDPDISLIEYPNRPGP